jgi:hypothetical protein
LCKKSSADEKEREQQRCTCGNLQKRMFRHWNYLRPKREYVKLEYKRVSSDT